MGEVETNLGEVETNLGEVQRFSSRSPMER